MSDELITLKEMHALLMAEGMNIKYATFRSAYRDQKWDSVYTIQKRGHTNVSLTKKGQEQAKKYAQGFILRQSRIRRRQYVKDGRSQPEKVVQERMQQLEDDDVIRGVLHEFIRRVDADRKERRKLREHIQGEIEG